MSAALGRPLITVVVPCYDEAVNIAPLSSALRSVLEHEGEYELVFVDDGSTDHTWETIQGLARTDARMRGVRLARNFGHQAALLAGLSAARGRAIVTMDADLQHPPEIVPLLIQHWREGAKVVHTQRSDSTDTTLVKRATSRWFYRLFSVLAGLPLLTGASDFRLMDRQVVRLVLRLHEGEYFLRGLINWLGFRSVVVPYQAAARRAGVTKYPLRRMVSLALSAITSFSVRPLRLGIGLGFLTALLAFAELVYVVVQAFRGATVPGWASAVGVTTLLFGVQFILIGLLGEYLGRVHLGVKRRPPFVIDERTDTTRRVLPRVEARGSPPRADISTS